MFVDRLFEYVVYIGIVLFLFIYIFVGLKDMSFLVNVIFECDVVFFFMCLYMYLCGKEFEYCVIFFDGIEEMFLFVDDYDFGW